MRLEDLIREAIQFGVHHREEINNRDYDSYDATMKKFWNKHQVKNLFIHSVSHCFFYDNELNHIRQWFNTTIDQHQDKDIEKTEWELALKIHTKLNLRPENRIVKNCG